MQDFYIKRFRIKYLCLLGLILYVPDKKFLVNFLFYQWDNTASSITFIIVIKTNLGRKKKKCLYMALMDAIVSKKLYNQS